MAKPKKYQDLTPAGQKKRLAKYEKEREANGTKETTARLVREAVIKDIKDGNKQAIFDLALHEKGAEQPRFVTMRAFIAKGKDTLEEFYRNLTPKHLLSVTYREINGYNNVWNMMDRTEAYKANKAKKESATANEEVQEEPPLEV